MIPLEDRIMTRLDIDIAARHGSLEDRTIAEVRDRRAARNWHADRVSGWSPSERVRRQLVNQGEPWSL